MGGVWGEPHCRFRRSAAEHPSRRALVAERVDGNRLSPTAPTLNARQTRHCNGICVRDQRLRWPLDDLLVQNAKAARVAL